jgi:hypothetical protein
MTCQELQLWCHESAARRPGDLASAPSDVSEHLSNCAACQASLKLDQHICEQIKQVDLPTDGVATMLWNVRRRQREWQRARVLYWSMSAAAALLLAVMLGWYFQRPYDLNTLVSKVNQIDVQKVVSSQQFPAPIQAADLKAWLNRQGLTPEIPKKLRLQFLTAAYIIEVQGRKVAVLELRTGGNISRVCLLERRYFPESLHRQLKEEDNLASHIIADSDDSNGLGWMIVNQGSAMLFVDDVGPNGGA